ncbi:class I SAM-dependent methyltransferase [Geomonas sp. Red32]|uniref:class I SAM-dependent methyltransferase n=1 Tax=Geomonas sp. Red32 TaxID=2912856 RepID=UPI00202CCC78|nr:class I SAM-dependent methyltransferase [Geomonas sp. Red32]MCM0081368.1 class I SAM-dependent methyltransferase [Geomonas sp. Red32]
MPSVNPSPAREMFRVADRVAKHFAKGAVVAALIPVDYTRTREIPLLLETSGILARRDEPLTILDIGSPQILALTLCSLSPHWKVRYINPYEPELRDLTCKQSLLGIPNLDIARGDITDPASLSSVGPFDYVFSCSVWEHIRPESDGDIVASANVSRLLKPSGRFIFSVPFYRTAFNEYVDGGVYGAEGGGAKSFFQRFYDPPSLNRRVVEPSGLTLESARYLGERYCSPRITRRISSLVDTGFRRFLLGRLFALISRLCMVEAATPGDLKKPYLAVCSLRKPESIGGSTL